MKNNRLVMASLLTLLLSACGQTGPLYLPAEQKTKASPSVEQSQDAKPQQDQQPSEKQDS